MVTLYAVWYNFVRIHKSVRVAPAMAAGVADRLWSMKAVEHESCDQDGGGWVAKAGKARALSESPATGGRMILDRRSFLVIGLAGSVVFIGLRMLFHKSELMQEDSDSTKRAVLARIAIGTPIEEAQTIMKAEGFRCTRMHTGFSEDRPGGGQQISNPPADILWCDTGDRVTPILIISQRWQVMFVEQVGRVARVAVSVGLTGL